MLICTVRGCRQNLIRTARTWQCGAGHTFDISRSGYVNLLQPQDRKSKHPGDKLDAVQGRRRLHDSGATQPLLAAIQDVLRPNASEAILDAGCGEGVDISIPAIDAAAKRYSAAHWVVANADRMLPYQDAAFDAAMSITARMNVAEFQRVVRPGGRLLVAIAAPDDLIELRGEGRDDRLTRTRQDFASFTLTGERRVTCYADLDAATLQGVLHAIYRPLTKPPASGMRVTLSLDLLLFQRPA
jgi:23S rRNA (guanine745-N1)-methyltransferase